MEKKTAVWVHGLHLQLENWREIVWGKPPNLLGRVPKAVIVALEEEAELLGFGTGFSEKDGKKEAEYTRDYLLEHFFELTAFRAVHTSIVFTKEWIKKISVLEMRSQNTKEEAIFAVDLLEERGIEKLFVVSSPVHLPRCLRDYCAAVEKKQGRLRVSDIYATPSQTGWAGPSETVIIEPPHRPDDLAGDLRQKVAKMLLQPDKLLEIKKALGL